MVLHAEPLVSKGEIYLKKGMEGKDDVGKLFYLEKLEVYPG